MARRDEPQERFRRLERLGEGATATVWRCEDLRTGAQCALKVLHPGLVVSPPARMRFTLEARVLQTLRHRHVIGLVEAATDGAEPCIAMELAPGGTLEERVPEGGVAPEVATSLLLQVSKGVRAAHEAGIVHRDLRPSSVLFGTRDVAKVSDFGSARIRGGGGTLEPTASRLLAYRAPEQRADPRCADPASDIYALGAILYTLLTGRTPPDLFAAEKAPELLAGLPEPFAAVVSRATRYAPAQRYPDAFALARGVHVASLDLARRS